MNSQAKKAVLIGLDGATLGLIQKYADEGVLPNLKRLMAQGVTTEAFCALPPATSVNWNTISTGAYAGTHGVVSMAMLDPNGPLDKFTSGFSSEFCLAEHIWDACERQDKTPLLLKYTTSWPPTIKKGIQVEGYGDPDGTIFAISPKTVYTDEQNRIPAIFGATKHPGRNCVMSFQVNLKPAVPYGRPVGAAGWKNLPQSKKPPLETQLPLVPIKGKPKTFYGLIFAKGEGYDTIIISPEKDSEKKWAQIGVGEFSPWLTETFETPDGPKSGTFRFKLYTLSPEAKKIRLYRSIIYQSSGWTYPASLADELLREIGPFDSIAAIPVPGRWIGRPEQVEFFADEFGYQGQWLARAAKYLMNKYNWDLFCTQFHAIDLTDHSFFSALDPDDPFHSPGSKAIETAYRQSDEYVGKILEELDDDAFICVVSDHGFIEPLGASGAPPKAGKPRGKPGSSLNVNQLLVKAGLQFHKEVEALVDDSMVTGAPGKVTVIDWSRTRAVETGNFIWINLKGRQPNGIVSPEEYEPLRSQIISLIEGASPPTDPEARYAQIVLRREDAEVFGLWGERVGDLVWFAKTEYKGGHHGNFHTYRARFGSMRAVAIFKGPGVKKGVMLPRPINLVDIAPTISTAIKIPIPRNCEGRSLQEIWD